MASVLTGFFERSQSEPFEWGKNDCALWAATYVYEQTGIDPAESLRGKYSSYIGCEKLLKKHGGLRKVCHDLMKCFPDGRDVCMFNIGGQDILGLIVNDKAAFKSPNGLILTKKMPDIVFGWSIQGHLKVKE